MVFCGNCEENVKPKTHFSWCGSILGLGIFYLMYFITKIPQCPNCNFPMPRRTMVFAIQLPQYYIKLAAISVLHLTHFKDRVVSASSRSYLNRKSDPSQTLRRYENTPNLIFNMMVSEAHNSISLRSHEFRK